MLTKSNVLFFDRQTDSLWSQLYAVAVTGPMAGTKLPVLPAVHSSWSRCKEKHPQTTVLSFDTGHRRDYMRDPYSSRLMDRRLVLAVSLDGTTKIYPFSELRKAGARVRDKLAGKEITIEFDRQQETASARGTDGEPIGAFFAYFTQLKAFYPDAEIFKAK